MKWLPEPSEPSCSGQLPRDARRPARHLAARAAPSTRGAAVVPAPACCTRPADSGTAPRDLLVQHAEVAPARSSAVNWVRTAIIPQPMSTPTAAGMIAPSVGMTEPTVAPLPRCASGIRATCG